MMKADERTIGALAREALRVQDACNLSGLAHSFPGVLTRLRQLDDLGLLLERADQHPITRLWVDKLAQLAGVQGLGGDWASEAYRAVERLAAEADAAELASVGAHPKSGTRCGALTCDDAGVWREPSFDEALARWVERSQARIATEHRRQFPDSKQTPRELTIHAGGVRYVRIVASDGPSRSAFCFVERSTGNVFKAESWKAPAKGPRGNIYADDQGIASSGELYARR